MYWGFPRGAHTLRKYRSSSVELWFLVPARKTRTRHIRTAMERRNGAVIQQMRPALTIVVLCMYELLLSSPKSQHVEYELARVRR